MIRIKLYKEDCELCGACARIMPDIFEMGESAVKVKKKKVEDSLLVRLKNVIKNCAGDAIELI